MQAGNPAIRQPGMAALRALARLKRLCVQIVAEIYYLFCASFAQVSFSVIVRLNMGRLGWLSLSRVK